jgi:hypothetical protein
MSALRRNHAIRYQKQMMTCKKMQGNEDENWQTRYDINAFQDLGLRECLVLFHCEIRNCLSFITIYFPSRDFVQVHLAPLHQYETWEKL